MFLGTTMRANMADLLWRNLWHHFSGIAFQGLIHIKKVDATRAEDEQSTTFWMLANEQKEKLNFYGSLRLCSSDLIASRCRERLLLMVDHCRRDLNIFQVDRGTCCKYLDGRSYE